MFYDFNPRHQANHVQRRYLGTPGSSKLMIGTQLTDPKYQGECGQQYQKYTDCLVRTEFNRNQCRPYEAEVQSCQQQYFCKNTKQKKILSNWRKNKGIQVKSSYIPFKVFETGPQKIIHDD